MSSRAKLATAVLIGVLVGGAMWARDYARGAAFVVLAANLTGWPASVAAFEARPVIEEARRIPTRHGPLHARLYRPRGSFGRTVLMVSGVHAAGIEEPRLVGFARDMAAMGTAVMTLELPDLVRYTISPRVPDMIEDAVRALAEARELAPDGKVSLLGISFGGGLSIAAAGRAGIADRIAEVASFGGHGDLPRAMRYLCTGILPDGRKYPPHDYGVVVIALNLVDRLVPPGQVEPLRRGILTFLHASHVDMVDKKKAAEEFAQARTLAETMPEPARTVMQYVNTRDVAHLGPRLLPYVESWAADPALSPDRSRPPRAPVFLLHGADDNVIPAIESRLLADYLQQRSTPVRLLITPLITHAEIDRPPHVGEVVDLVGFWTDLLRQ